MWIAMVTKIRIKGCHLNILNMKMFNKTFVSFLAIVVGIAPANTRPFDGALEHNSRFRRDSPKARFDVKRVQIRITVASCVLRALDARVPVDKVVVQVAAYPALHNFDCNNMPMQAKLIFNLS